MAIKRRWFSASNRNLESLTEMIQEEQDRLGEAVPVKTELVVTQDGWYSVIVCFEYDDTVVQAENEDEIPEEFNLGTFMAALERLKRALEIPETARLTLNPPRVVSRDLWSRVTAFLQTVEGFGVAPLDQQAKKLLDEIDSEVP